MKDLRPDTPFKKHWLYYIVLKLALLAAALYVALRLFGWL